MTSIEVAKKLNSNSEKAFVVGGNGEVDAMSISAKAAELKAPIVVVEKDKLNEEAKALLENKEIEGKRAIDFFETKIKDPMVLADMQKAGNTSTDVILFNIDSKSESNYKTSKDAILKVFNKVFDEMQGYCGVLPWVADLERQMVKEGVYDKFKQVFKEESGYEWAESREDIFYEGDAVVAALNKARGMSEEAANNK